MAERRLFAGVAALCLVEAAFSATGLARLLPVLAAHGAPVLIVSALRAVVAAFECAAAVMLIGRRPPAVPFATAALLASALLRTIELGFGVAPTSVFPSWRWPLVGAYWGLALLALAVLRLAVRCGRRDRRD